MEVFIVRPFGNRPVLKENKKTGDMEKVMFNFDKVEEDLIRPAMKATNLLGGTTGEIFEAGDIREDMFSLLLLADIVIADITIHNANVFYELGIRHALRDKKTILIKCSGYDDTPFDIIGYRYLTYDKDAPASSVSQLVRMLGETILSDRKDSPVFNVLHNLKSQDPEKFHALPADFLGELQLASLAKHAGRLLLLANESENFGWEIPALRLIGESLYNMRAFEAARGIWEKIKVNDLLDVQANDRLATIYQRLAEAEMTLNPEEGTALLVKSDLAIENLLRNYEYLDTNRRAEVYALKARNAKNRWIDSWKKSNEEDRPSQALQSGFLNHSFELYEQGYYGNLNHFYSGINALGLLATIIALAEAQSETWELSFATKAKADQELDELKQKFQRISVAVQLALEGERRKLDALGRNDPWLSITEADFACLTNSTPARVTLLYKKALEGANGLNTDATYRQLKLYEGLGIKTENVKAALKSIPAAQQEKPEETHYLLFTGHMIDKPDRKEPRFPAAKEGAVRKEIARIVQLEKDKNKGTLIGIAGGACGGDILFHEVCQELQIKTELYLALPREQFIEESVAFAGTDWVERFNSLYKNIPKQILSTTKELPKWLQKRKDYSIWERNNLWELYSALSKGGINTTLVALWDGKGGDGPGGTQHMIEVAKKMGATTKIIKIEQLN